MLRPPRDENGIAMVTAILVSAVILTLSITAASLTIHNTDQSGLDRKRLQVVAAAEAGVNTAFATLEATPMTQLPCTMSGNLTASPVQQYTASIKYYDGSNNLLTCNTGGGVYLPSNPSVLVSPAKAVITSTGVSVPSNAGPAAKRTIQSQIGLHPVYGGFAQAIFSDQSPTTNNNLTVNGTSGGDDATVYTNGNWSCANSMTVHGSMVAQGSVSMSNSCQVSRDVWAKQAVTMQNNTVVGHNVNSSRSSITLQNSGHILNNATAGTTVTSGGQSCATPTAGACPKVDGIATQNATPNDPPTYTLPTLTWDQSAWTGWNLVSQSTCTPVTGTITTKTVYRVTPACNMSWSNNTTITLSADLAIVTDGGMSMTNQVTFQSNDSTVRNILFIVPSNGAYSCSGATPANFSTSNNTSFVNLRTFIYTPCSATYANNNAGVGGQIFAGKVTISNQFTLNFLPETIPGNGTITGYKADIAYVREIVNP